MIYNASVHYMFTDLRNMIIIHVECIKSHTHKKINIKLFLLIVMKSAVNSSDKLSMAVIQAEQYHDLVLDSVLRG